MTLLTKLRVCWRILTSGDNLAVHLHELLTKELERATAIAQYGACPHCEGSGTRQEASYD